MEKSVAQFGGLESLPAEAGKEMVTSVLKPQGLGLARNLQPGGSEFLPRASIYQASQMTTWFKPQRFGSENFSPSLPVWLAELHKHDLNTCCLRLLNFWGFARNWQRTNRTWKAAWDPERIFIYIVKVNLLKERPYLHLHDDKSLRRILIDNCGIKGNVFLIFSNMKAEVVAIRTSCQLRK